MQDTEIWRTHFAQVAETALIGQKYYELRDEAVTEYAVETFALEDDRTEPYGGVVMVVLDEVVAAYVELETARIMSFVDDDRYHVTYKEAQVALEEAENDH